MEDKQLRYMTLKVFTNYKHYKEHGLNVPTHLSFAYIYYSEKIIFEDLHELSFSSDLKNKGSFRYLKYDILRGKVSADKINKLLTHYGLQIRVLKELRDIIIYPII